MKIALYMRVSTGRQQQNQTIEQQFDRLQEHIQAHPEWQLSEEHIYQDDGYSGASLNRPGLDRLREQAAMAAFELVLLTAPDRIARKYVYQVLLIEELRNSCSSLIAEAISRMRDGRVIRDAGYDGQYGTTRLFEDNELKKGESIS